MDDRLGGYFRRYQLALRMMAHGARTQTIMAWTGLTRDQLVTQRRRWGFGSEDRQRGPAPSAYHVFFRSRRRRGEAALFVALCRILGALIAYAGEIDAKKPPNLANGELICGALEAFRAWQPQSDLDFEHAIQLASGVVRTDQVVLGHCPDCQGATIFAGACETQDSCGHCSPRPNAMRGHRRLAPLSARLTVR